MKYAAWLFGILLMLPVPTQAQSSRISVERVLEPLGDFDPFDEQIATERYFPDEIERRVRRAMVDALIRRSGGLGEHVSYLEDADEKRVAEGGRPSGLAPS